MMEEMEMADRSAHQSAKDKNTLQKQYITALPVGKDTVEIYVEDFERYIRADTKLELLTQFYEKGEMLTQGGLYIFLGVDGGKR